MFSSLIKVSVVRFLANGFNTRELHNEQQCNRSRARALSHLMFQKMVDMNGSLAKLLHAWRHEIW